MPRAACCAYNDFIIWIAILILHQRSKMSRVDPARKAQHFNIDTVSLLRELSFSLSLPSISICIHISDSVQFLFVCIHISLSRSLPPTAILPPAFHPNHLHLFEKLSVFQSPLPVGDARRPSTHQKQMIYWTVRLVLLQTVDNEVKKDNSRCGKNWLGTLLPYTSPNTLILEAFLRRGPWTKLWGCGIRRSIRKWQC